MDSTMTDATPATDPDVQMDPEMEVEVDAELEGYIHTQKLILAASTLDLDALRETLDDAGANVQDPETLMTPLHAAMLAVVLDQDGDDGNEKEGSKESMSTDVKSVNQQKPQIDETRLPAAKEAVQLLLENGAVWNDTDANEETPGCLAAKLGLTEIYDMIVDAGVRAELLLRMAGYFMLGSDDDDDEEEEEAEEEAEEEEGGELEAVEREDENMETIPSTTETNDAGNTDPLSNAGYLSKTLPPTLPSGDLVDADSNAVMMSWETPLMEAHAAALLPTTGKRILNIGHGMGIFDGIVRDRHFPAAHHIVEAHSSVLERMGKAGWKTGSSEYPPSPPSLAAVDAGTEGSAARPSSVDVVIHEGTWQSEVPKLVESINAGTLPPFDAVYYDTFAESYDDFREFAGHVPELLGGRETNPNGRFGFFFGAGADRQICYDVYTRIADMDMRKLGFVTKWEDIPVADLEAEGVWKDVARPYWNIKVYRMPTCSWATAREDQDGS